MRNTKLDPRTAMEMPLAVRALGRLSDRGCDRGERPPEQGPREPERHGPPDRQPVGHQRGRRDYAQGQVGAEGDEEGREKGRLPPEGGRAEELAPSGLLLRAGVPDDGQQARKTHEQNRSAEAPRGDGAEAVPEGVPVEGEEGRGARDYVDVGLALCGRRVEVFHGVGDGDGEQGQHQDPERQHYAVAAQDQSHERPSSG